MMFFYISGDDGGAAEEDDQVIRGEDGRQVAQWMLSGLSPASQLLLNSARVSRVTSGQSGNAWTHPAQLRQVYTTQHSPTANGNIQNNLIITKFRGNCLQINP